MMQKAGTKKENRLVKSIKGTKSEFKKIVWPTWKQVAKNTMIVIAVVVLFCAIIAVLDYLFKFGVIQWFTK